MNALMKMAYYAQKTTGGALAGAAIGAGVGELKHRRNVKKGKESSRAKHLLGGAGAGAGAGALIGAGHEAVKRRGPAYRHAFNHGYAEGGDGGSAFHQKSEKKVKDAINQAREDSGKSGGAGARARSRLKHYGRMDEAIKATQG